MFYKTVAIWLCQIVYPHIPVKYEKYNLLYVFARHFLKEHQDPTLSIMLSSKHFYRKLFECCSWVIVVVMTMINLLVIFL